MRKAGINLRLLELALFVVICLSCQQTLCDQGPGWVFPTTVEQLVGRDFNISCTINETYFKKNTNATCGVEQLYFSISNANTVYKTEPDIVRVNRTTILLTARNATIQEHDYRCMCDNNVIMPAKVFVGTKPALVTDFNCVSRAFYYMVCNFTTPPNKLITKYNVSFTLPKSPNYLFTVPCDFDNSPHVICNITGEKYKKFSEIYNFRLDMSNNLSSTRQTIVINQMERMELETPGQNLTVLNKTQSSICMSWEMVRRSNVPRGFLWSIRVVPEDMPELRDLSLTNSSLPLRDILCIRQLPYAGYNYTLLLRIRVNISHSIWSKTLEYQFKTAPDRPRRPPRVTNGGFYVYSSETQLRIYWEQLQQHEYCGDNFGYAITEYRMNGTLGNLSHIQVEANSAVLKNWNKDTSYEIYTRSRNNVSVSVEASRLFIPAISNEDIRVRVPKNIRSVYNNQSHTLSWEPPERSDGLLNYTVFWCNPKPAVQSECEGSVHFRNVSGDVHYFTTASGQSASLNMAVSANFERYNTGMHWLICTRDVTDDLAKMEPTIDAVTNTTITVKWSSERVCPVILSGYNLTYCKLLTDKPNKCTTKTIKEKYSKSYVIRDLEPHTPYSVKMLMYSERTSSKDSDELFNQTAEAAPTNPRDLSYLNVTGSSATLTWKPPLKANGLVRTYVVTLMHDNKTDSFTLPAKTVELVDNNVVYELNNLTAYTDYAISIRARTVSDSEPSNVIQFRTAVGVPSSLLLNGTTTDQRTILRWTAPSRPAGRIEYYEVVINEHNSNNTLVNRVVSYVMPRQNCSYVLDKPTCRPLHHFVYQVRAVNLESVSDAAAAVFSEPASADNPGPTEAELSLIGSLNNSELYRQYASDWSEYTVDCSPDNSGQKYLLKIIPTVVMFIMCLVLLRVAYYQYQKMSNIKCELPAGILEGWKKPIDMGTLDAPNLPNGSIAGIPEEVSPPYIPQSDFSYSNESAKLLFSAASSPGLCLESEGAFYTYDDRSDSTGATYMPMRESDSGSINDLQTDQQDAVKTEPGHGNNALAMTNGTGGYIKPTQMKNWSPPTAYAQHNNANILPLLEGNQQPPPPPPPSSMPLSGYVPVQMLQTHKNGKPAAAMLNTGNYVQASDLQQLKHTMAALNGLPRAGADIMPMPNMFGYTALEDLERVAQLKQQQALAMTTLTPQMPAAHANGPPQHTADAHMPQQPPPQQQISGYVTPQELNSLSHQGHVL